MSMRKSYLRHLLASDFEFQNDMDREEGKVRNQSSSAEKKRYQRTVPSNEIRQYSISNRFVGEH